MSGFDLVPVDGGNHIHLAPGETVLGRGPLLGVSDKRVSRNHGLLENLNGRLRLKPTHLNPCFVQTSLTDDPRPLPKDSWFPLQHGDFFSLLPGQFIYKVVAVGGEECTPRKSQTLEEEEDRLPVSPRPDVEAPPVIGQGGGQTPPEEVPTSGNVTSAASSSEEETCKGLDKGDTAAPEEVENNVSPSVEKKRVLPAWMMAVVAASPDPSSTLTVQSAVKRSTTPAAASTNRKRAAAKQAPPSAAEEAGLSEEAERRPSKKRRKLSDEAAAQSKTDIPSQGPTVRSGGLTLEVDEVATGPETSRADRNTTTRQTTKQADSVRSSVPAAPKSRLRTPCPYGKDCYRKNPVHFQECSHPGDTDYEEEEAEEEEDRPECPYGTDCYRKNPLHRREYRHAEKPARSTRTVPRKAPKDDEDEGDGSEDDDSFINDNSEDVGDDSDYAPPDSDDSGKEDVRRLQREAKVFLQRRK